jgi:hypothetical protein
MSITLTTGHNFTNGDTANAVNLNAMVNSATYAGVLEQTYGGTGTSGAIATLTYGGTTNLDFSIYDVQTISLTGNVTFTTSNLAAGLGKVVRIICDATPRTLTFPAGWTFMTVTTPATIAASKVAMLSLLAFGASDSNVIAAYVVQP